MGSKRKNDSRLEIYGAQELHAGFAELRRLGGSLYAAIEKDSALGRWLLKEAIQSKLARLRERKPERRGMGSQPDSTAGNEMAT